MRINNYIKIYWDEEDIWFYISFKGEYAEKQLEIHPASFFMTHKEKVFDEESMLYDQKLSDLELNENNYISKEEFEKKWNEYLSKVV